jgi:hypothetical protein
LHLRVTLEFVLHFAQGNFRAITIRLDERHRRWPTAKM